VRRDARAVRAVPTKREGQSRAPDPVKVTSLSKRDMCRETAVACGAAPAGSYLVDGPAEGDGPVWPTRAHAWFSIEEDWIDRWRCIQ
jgi:hypothetical protein